MASRCHMLAWVRETEEPRQLPDADTREVPWIQRARRWSDMRLGLALRSGHSASRRRNVPMGLPSTGRSRARRTAAAPRVEGRGTQPLQNGAAASRNSKPGRRLGMQTGLCRVTGEGGNQENKAELLHACQSLYSKGHFSGSEGSDLPGNPRSSVCCSL